MESRSRRDVSKKSAAKLAIERMMAVKNGTAKRSEQLEAEMKDEESIFEEVSEEAYKDIVESRRAARFVEEDNGIGYADDGEEERSDGEYDDVEDDAMETGKRGRKPNANTGARKKLNSALFNQTTKLTFARPVTIGPVKADAAAASAAAPPACAAATDFDLESLLGELDAAPNPADRRAGASAAATGRTGGAGVGLGLGLGVGRALRRPAEAVRAAAKRTLFDADAAPAAAAHDDDYDVGGAGYDDDDHMRGGDARDDAGGDAGGGGSSGGAAAGAGDGAAERGVDPAARGRWKVQAKAPAPSVVMAVTSEPAPVSLLAAPTELLELGDLDAVGSADAAASTSLPVMASGSTTLPVTPEGSLMMFWIDAYEDPVNMPGTLYLFGKVLVQAPSTYASCCVSMTGIDRHVYVLPREKAADGDAAVSFGDLYAELRDAVVKVVPPGKGKFMVKKVRKNYAFELPGVPRHETEYLELKYSFKFPALPSDISGRTFSKCFGTRTSALETLLLKQDIMGPCWLEIKNFKTTSVKLSFCMHEVHVDAMTDVAPLSSSVKQPPAPPLSVMSLSLKTVVNPRTHTHEVVVASILHHRAVSVDGPTNPAAGQLSRITAVAAPVNAGVASLPLDLRDVLASKYPHLQATLKPMPNERALLSFLVARIANLDPDVIVGHNITGFDMDVLLHRIAHNSVPNWSSIGRLRRSQLPRVTAGSNGQETFVGVLAAGRLVCDTYLSAREVLRETTYTLSNLARTQLGTDRREVDPLEVPRFFGESASVLGLCRHTENDAHLAMQLMFKLQVLPLTRQLTNLAGNLWSRSLKGARAERIEYLLLHTFHNAGYIVPDKEFGGGGGGGGGGKREGPRGKPKKKPAYSGGLVLEPKRGLYDKYVLLLDFNSLYPSIIQEYNICFTTVERPLGLGAGSKAGADADDGAGGDDGDGDGDGAVDLSTDLVPRLPDPAKYPEPGILPRVIRTLVERRREVKKLLKNEKDPATKQQLDIRQMALKILANSMYGCLGFSNSRFFARPIAALVTSQGREILQNTVNLARSTLNLDVIYGDTDSIMIHTNSDNIDIVRRMGEEVKAAVNKLYKLLEIEIDGLFKMMLLLKKKKYAALVAQEGPGGVVTFKRETKGLDLVRRDWCIISREIGGQVLDLILSGKEKEEVVESIHALLSTFAAESRAGSVPLEKFVITKGLNKAPKDYPDAKGQPHLQVATRMIANGKTVNVGDHIPYVICVEETPVSLPGGSPGQPQAAATSSASIASRAYHPDEVKKSNGTLKVDAEWYLSQQILPPIARLCEPIQETSQARIAECLGLDASRFQHKYKTGEDDGEGMMPKRLLNPAERFKLATPFPVVCQRCHTPSAFPLAPSTLSPAGDAAVAPSSSLVCTRPGCGGLWRSGVSLAGVGGSDGVAMLTDMPHPPGPAGADVSAAELDFCRASLANGLTLAVRQHILEYSQHWMKCDDSMCGVRTRQQPIGRQGRMCVQPRCRGLLQPEKSDDDLHTQLEYYVSLFSPEARSKAGRLPFGHEAIFKQLHQLASAFMDHSAYHVVDSKAVFGYMDRMRKPTEL